MLKLLIEHLSELKSTLTMVEETSSGETGSRSLKYTFPGYVDLHLSQRRLRAYGRLEAKDGRAASAVSCQLIQVYLLLIWPKEQPRDHAFKESDVDGTCVDPVEHQLDSPLVSYDPPNCRLPISVPNVRSQNPGLIPSK